MRNNNSSLVNSLEENHQGKDNEILINPIDFLPKNMAGIVRDLESKLNWNPDFCILPMLVVGAGAIGNSRNSSFASYDVISTLYGMLVGRASVNKSQPQEFAVEPLRKKFEDEYKSLEYEMEQWNQLPDAEKKGKEEPKKVFNFLDSATIEKVVVSLKNNPRGCFQKIDELKGLFLSFQKYQGSDIEQTYLSLWSGIGKTHDTISRGTTYTGSNPRISIIGTIQPDVIHKHFKGRDDNGLKERFLTAYPDVIPQPKSRTATQKIKADIQKRWRKIIDSLLSLDSLDDNGYIPFDADAEDRLFQWDELNTKRKIDYPEFDAMLGKIDVIVPRLAMILQLIENPESKSINKQNADRGCMLGEHYILNAQKVIRLIKYGDEKNRNQRGVSKRKLHSLLPDEFETKDAHALADSVNVSIATIDRYLKDTDFFESAGHGKYRLKSINL